LNAGHLAPLDHSGASRDGPPPASGTFTGTDAGETITGTAQEDTINGLGGNDILIGLSSADVLNGGNGDDVLRPYAGGGTFDGGEGVDTLDFSQLLISVTVDLRIAGVQDALGGGMITLVGIENITGSRNADTLIGDDGANTINGWSDNDIIEGLGSNDVLLGGSNDEEDFDGDDTLDGGSGDDTLNGENGADILTGGTGDDLFIYTIYGGPSQTDVPDTITDFTAGGSEDSIQTTALSYYLVQEGANLRVVFTDDASLLLLNVEAADFTAQDINIGLYNLIAGTSAGETLGGTVYRDQISGSDGNDILNGKAADDILLGGAGNDVLRGEAGADTLNGGNGTDRADYSTVATAVTVDLRIAGAQDTGQGLDTLIGIEQLRGSTKGDTLIGDDGANQLDGDNGNDVLTGNGGNDALIGGGGADALNGGAGMDYASFATSTSAVSIDLATGVHGGDAAGDTFISIERYRLSEQADTFVGGSLNDQVYGAEGADSLSGGDGLDKLYGEVGADTLNGDDGNDILIGGEGADVLNGGAGRDTVSYETMTHGIIMNLFVGSHSDDAAGDTFDSVEVFWLTGFNDMFTGSAGDDEVRGNDGLDTLNGQDGSDRLRGEDGADTLNGDGGDDFLWGDAGADTLNGGAGTDYACYTYSRTGLTIDLATGVNTGEAAGDTYVSVERFQLTNQSTQADFFVGTSGDDWVAGYKGVDTIDGGDGNDTINGGGQNDILNGGAGDDRIVGDTGNDLMTGGTGMDWFRAIAFGFGHDTVTDFENGVDKLRFTGMAGVDDFSDFVVTTNGDGWAVVTLSDGSSITLTGMLASDVDASDFLFT
jgi:Ca2+-binding RTX toxin-like protein